MPRSSSTSRRKQPRKAYTGWTGPARPTDLERDRAKTHGKGSATKRSLSDMPADIDSLGEMESIGEGCYRRLPTTRD